MVYSCLGLTFTTLGSPCHSLAGFVDIFSKSKDRIAAHASKILKFLHRNRIPSGSIPFPVLEGYNSVSSMRAAVLQDYLDNLLQKEKGSSYFGQTHVAIMLKLKSGFEVGFFGGKRLLCR